MTTPVKPESIPRVPTYDEWQAAQYAPHRLGTDPTKPMPLGRVPTFDEFEQAQRSASPKSLTFPAMPKFAADATARLNPNAGPADKSVPEQMGAGVRKAAESLDLASQVGDANVGVALKAAAIMGRQVVAPAVEYPLLTAALANPVGAVIGTGMAVHTIAQYGWQKAQELGMSPEDRAKSEADPNRVSGEAAAVQAVMLGLGSLAGVHSITKSGDVGAGMMEAGAAGLKDLRPTDATLSEYIRTDKASIESQQASERGAKVVKELADQRAHEAELRQEELTRQAALRALTGVRRRPAGISPEQYYASPDGAKILGATASTKGLPETASPFPPASPLDVSWKEGHAIAAESYPEGFTMGGALTENRIPSDFTPQKLPRTEPTAPPPPADQSVIPLTEGPNYKGPKSLYGRLSDDALGTEYRALIDKRTAEQPNAIAPLWTPEREAEAVDAIESRRRPDGSLSPADKGKLAYLQAAQGEEYNIGRHTFESAAAERRVAEMDKHITAIEKEMEGRGLKPEDAMQPPQTGGGGLAPIEGTGDVKTRGLSASTERDAIAAEVADHFRDLPKYSTMDKADQGARAADLLLSDPERAQRVALGEEPPPQGLHPEAVYIAVKHKAIAEGDAPMIDRLVDNRLTTEATTMGQRISLLDDHDPTAADPVKAIQRINDSRTAGAKNPERAIANEVNGATKTVKDMGEIDMSALTKFINSLRC